MIKNRDFITINQPRALAGRLVTTAADGLHADRPRRDLFVPDGDVEASRIGFLNYFGAPGVHCVDARFAGDPGNAASAQVYGAAAVDDDFVTVRAQDVTWLNPHFPRFEFVGRPIRARHQADLSAAHHAPSVHHSIVPAQLAPEILLLQV